MSHFANCHHDIICKCRGCFIDVIKGCEKKNDLGFLVSMVGGVKTMTMTNPHQMLLKNLGHGTDSRALALES